MFPVYLSRQSFGLEGIGVTENSVYPAKMIGLGLTQEVAHGQCTLTRC